MAKSGFSLRKLGMMLCGLGLGMMFLFMTAFAATSVPDWFGWVYKIAAYGFLPCLALGAILIVLANLGGKK